MISDGEILRFVPVTYNNTIEVEAFVLIMDNSSIGLNPLDL